MILNENPNTLHSNCPKKGAEIVDLNAMRKMYAYCLQTSHPKEKFKINFSLLENAGVDADVIRSFASYAAFNNEVLDLDVIRSLVARSMFLNDDPMRRELVA
jgi:hypothetical protein